MSYVCLVYLSRLVSKADEFAMRRNQQNSKVFLEETVGNITRSFFVFLLLPSSRTESTGPMDYKHKKTAETPRSLISRADTMQRASSSTPGPRQMSLNSFMEKKPRPRFASA
uniref:Secreted protein n=1 Tax=Steinernema glaseri TaxID=37863 RepID=A0A1I8ALL4_9BILA